MKNFVSFGAHTALFASAIILALLPVGISLRLMHGHHIPMSFNGGVTSNGDQDSVTPKEGAKEELGMELYPTGSSLPDCACAKGNIIMYLPIDASGWIRIRYGSKR
ncbi:hypothetical protein HHK36_004091 [Tetracentron sinense]|uniref:Uncharacterized protein n=1 Tax=Tetracentron sinense TaxID=13715 RepID=A0A834ZS87_TETSI|nr:hypothetical protein HHK36_004091 [Tetracentron sinense]